jgi:hypothetical protein
MVRESSSCRARRTAELNPTPYTLNPRELQSNVRESPTCPCPSTRPSLTVAVLSTAKEVATMYCTGTAAQAAKLSKPSRARSR